MNTELSEVWWLGVILRAGIISPMDATQPAPRKIAIAMHPSMAEATEEGLKIQAYLLEQGVEKVIRSTLQDQQFRRELKDGGYDLLIALGGDGTMLRAGHLCGPIGLPVLGINLGRFGFLMEVKRKEWQTMLPLLFEGRYRLEQRMMLIAEHLRGERVLGEWTVLNEVVVCRGRYVRPVRLKACVDGYPLATYIADGLIVATATGSTAYAMAVGGPIMPPELRSILIVAVAPHLSVDRAVILAEGSVVTVSVDTSHQAVMSVDGQSPIAMENGDIVRVQGNDSTVKFVRFRERGYFYKNLTEYMEQNPAAGDIE